MSLLVFEGGTTRQDVVRYYEVPSLTREQVTRRIEYGMVAPLGPWIEERGERARRAVSEGLLGVSKHGITPFRGQPSASTHRYRRVEVGDFVYNPTRAELGSIALCRDAGEEGWVSREYVVFRLTAAAPFDAEHLLRFLKSKPGRLAVSRLSCGSVRRRLRFEDLRQSAVPYAD